MVIFLTFAEGYKPAVLHVSSQLMDTNIWKVNIMILHLFHQPMAKLTFHWLFELIRLFLPRAFLCAFPSAQSTFLHPQPLSSWLSLSHLQGLSLMVTSSIVTPSLEELPLNICSTSCNSFICMFLLIPSPASCVKLHSGQGPSLSFLQLFYISVPYPLALSKYTIKHLLNELANVSWCGRCRSQGLEKLNIWLSVRQLGIGLKLRSAWLQNCSMDYWEGNWWEDFQSFLPLYIPLQQHENFDSPKVSSPLFLFCLNVF